MQNIRECIGKRVLHVASGKQGTVIKITNDPIFPFVVYWDRGYPQILEHRRRQLVFLK